MTDLNSLLDATIDDLADLPAFKPFPKGANKATISFEMKEVNKQQAVILNMVGIESVELEEGEEPLKAGDKDNVMFTLSNEFGQGKLKKVLAELRPHFGGNSLKEIMEAAKGAEVIVVSKHRKDKNDPDKVYTDIQKILVV